MLTWPHPYSPRTRTGFKMVESSSLAWARLSLETLVVSWARLDSFLFLGGGGKKESGQTALDVSFILCHKNRGRHAQKLRGNFLTSLTVQRFSGWLT